MRKEIQDAIEAEAVSFIAAIDAMQTGRVAAREPLFQGLPTHDTPPRDGEQKTVEATRKPTRQADNWRDVLTMPATLRANYQIDTYGGPLGEGYVITQSVEDAGVRYERAINQGPETWREHTWRPAATPVPARAGQQLEGGRP